MVAFTSRAERLDPEDLGVILRSYHDRVRLEIESFGGVTEKFIGDAVVGIFGAPTAYGDDPERAVRAALAVRTAIAELNRADEALDLHVRIGVNTGDALVTMGARPELGEGMVTGDVVNMAARLQQNAPADGILAGLETYACTRDAVTYGDVISIAAKGKSTPLQARPALDSPSRSEPAPRRPIVGREREMQHLRQIWAQAEETATPHLVTVLAPPGVGKTRLSAEFSVAVRDAGGRVVRGRSLPYRESSAYGAFAAQVKQLAGIFESDSLEVGRAKLRRTVDGLGAVDADAVTSHLGILIGLEPEQTVADRETLFFSVRCFIEAVAEDRPDDARVRGPALGRPEPARSRRAPRRPAAREPGRAARPGAAGAARRASGLGRRPAGVHRALPPAARQRTSPGSSRMSCWAVPGRTRSRPSQPTSRRRQRGTRSSSSSWRRSRWNEPRMRS